MKTTGIAKLHQFELPATNCYKCIDLTFLVPNRHFQFLMTAPELIFEGQFWGITFKEWYRDIPSQFSSSTEGMALLLWAAQQSVKKVKPLVLTQINGDLMPLHPWFLCRSVETHEPAKSDHSQCYLTICVPMRIELIGWFSTEQMNIQLMVW